MDKKFTIEDMHLAWKNGRQNIGGSKTFERWIYQRYNIWLKTTKEIADE